MRARRATLIAALGLLTLGLVATGLPAVAAGNSSSDPVTLCHRTRAVTNPYRRITVAQSAVTGNNGVGSGNSSGHDGHSGGLFVTTTGYYGTHAKDWGDVIPPFGNYRGLNSTGTLPDQCTGPTADMTAAQFYNLQREAGVPRDEIIGDLQAQGATGDPDVTQLATLVYTGQDSTLVTEDQVATGAGPTPTPEHTPTPTPTPTPTVEPTPTPEPTVEPSVAPTTPPTPEPTAEPTIEPTAQPTPTTTPSATPTPTSTASATATARPTPASPTGTQEVTGTVWLDLDRNGRQQGATEVGLGLVSVDLFRVDLAGGRGARASGMSTGLHGATSSTLVATVTTDASGGFAFRGLAAGTYSVVVRRPSALAVTWDSEGVADAAALVLLPESGSAQAQVGLVGDATARLVVTSPDGTRLSGSATLRWVGPDDVFDTADDLPVPVSLVDGALTLAGLPSGRYRIEAGVGRTALATVTTAGLTSRVVLTRVLGASGSLAATGTSVAPATAVAAVLLLAGVLMVLARRRASHPESCAGLARGLVGAIRVGRASTCAADVRSAHWPGWSAPAPPRLHQEVVDDGADTVRGPRVRRVAARDEGRSARR
ncbi:SdrD B-like domain-containing protein [Cellulomonas soli]|uniref:SdrD B-like domain-containing protein n=1 Tax=Cellulomonas soli TaxID=931535 RepID=UPI003F82AC0B